MGEGHVWTDHGLLPVPAPATLRLMEGMKVCSGPVGATGELVTPTAMALLRVLAGAEHCAEMPDMTVTGVGLGAGTKDFPNHPNVLRLILGVHCPGRVDVPSKHFPPIRSLSLPVQPGIPLFQTGSETKNMPRQHYQPQYSLTPTFQQRLNFGDLFETKKLFDELEKENESIRQALAETIIPLQAPTAATKIETAPDTVEDQSSALWTRETLVHLEANIDDTTPEILAYTIERLLESGAMDAWIQPIVMKKGRPGYTLNCISPSKLPLPKGADKFSTDLTNKLITIIFLETTTLGIRIHRNVERASLSRSFLPVPMSYKKENASAEEDSDDAASATNVINVKVSKYQDKVVTIKPEMEDCKKVAIETGFPLRVVINDAQRQAEILLQKELEEQTPE